MGIPFFSVPDLFGDAERTIADLAGRLGLPPEAITGAVSGGLPVTRTRLSHAYQLRLSNGRPIGAVFRATAEQARDVTFKYHVDKNNRGEPATIVKGVVRSQTIQVSRFDLYTSVLEEAFGDFEFETIARQPYFQLKEVWRAPTGILAQGGKTFIYTKCSFTRTGREVGTEGDCVVRTNAEIQYLERWKV